MKLFKKEISRHKLLYGGLITTFAILYGATAFVSWYHAITFFNIANAVWLSVILSFVAEIGQASALFSLLLTENKNKFLTWFVMIILTSLQVVGNVVSSYDWIIKHNSEGVQSFQQSILFWIQTADPQIFKVVIAWISGALLPIIALSMTALVAQNMDLRAHNAKTKLDDDSKPDPLPELPVEPIDAKDLISEIAKVRPTTEDMDVLTKILNSKKPIEKVPVEEIPINDTPLQKKKEEGYEKTVDFITNEDLPKEEKKSKYEFKSPRVLTKEQDTGITYSAGEHKYISELLEREPEKEYGTDVIPPENSQLTDNEIMNQILDETEPGYLPHYSDEEVYEMNLDEHERTGSYNNELREDMDEEVERLSYPVNYEPQIDLLKNLAEDLKLTHTNGLVEGMEVIFPSPEPSPEPSPTPEPIPMKTEETKPQPLSEEQLEKIRQIAKDNLKKK